MKKLLYAVCPRCGGKYTVLDTIDISQQVETITCYAECDCGAADLVIRDGKIACITLRDPITVPECFDEPTGSQEDPEYMAL